MTKPVNTRTSSTTAENPPDYLTVMSGRVTFRRIKQLQQQSVEAHLRLCVDISTTFAQDLHHVSLAGQRGYMQRGVSFLQLNTIMIIQVSECFCKNTLRVLVTLGLSECYCVLY